MATCRTVRRPGPILTALVAAALISACETSYNENTFRKRAEEAYREVNPGWTIEKRTEEETIMIRGDQIDHLPVAEMFADYKASGKDGGDWFDAWMADKRAEAEARRRTVEQAKDDIVPIIKSGSWVKVQDLGAIGPARMRDQIRPWRKKIATDVYVVLGVPEEKLGYRLASIEEMEKLAEEDAWLERATKNLVRIVGTSTAGGASIDSNEGRLMVLDMPNTDGVSGLILDRGFRKKMLQMFEQPYLGAAAPVRNVLILFDPETWTATKPVRARTHQLYDTQNHPGFRGLLRIDEEGVSVIEPANPKKKGPRTQ